MNIPWKTLQTELGHKFPNRTAALDPTTEATCSRGEDDGTVPSGKTSKRTLGLPLSVFRHPDLAQKILCGAKRDRKSRR